MTTTVAPLFRENTADTAIVLWDVSGSTGNPYRHPSAQSASAAVGDLVYDQMAEVVRALPNKLLRFIFWCSPRSEKGILKRGVLVFDKLVTKANLKELNSVIALGRGVIGGGTCPSLGFEAVPESWLRTSSTSSTSVDVILMSDGQIGCSEMSDDAQQEALARCIRALPDNAQLSIIAVENETRDFGNAERMQSSAGGDIFRLVQRLQLTDKISKFSCFAINGTCVQIDRVKAPAGCAAFGRRFFSVLRSHEFFDFVRREIQAASADQNALMQIAQQLSGTLSTLTRDKPARVAEDILRSMAAMFGSTCLDEGIARFVLADGAENERKGQAGLLADFRQQAKNLFAEAGKALARDVCVAVGLSRGDFVTPVMSGRVLTGSFRLVDKPMTIGAVSFPRGAALVDGVPALPLLGTVGSSPPALADQCLRQWLRQVYGWLHCVGNITSDEIIFLVLADMVRVVRSAGIRAEVKTAFRQLALCMLRKKRLNSAQTELERLMSGNPPELNSGRADEFQLTMRTVAAKMQLRETPWNLWQAICECLEPVAPGLGRAQGAFWTEGQRQDSAEAKQQEEGKQQDTHSVEEDRIPTEFTLDFNCLITLDDVSAVGGFKMREHGQVCAPVYVLSAEGKRQMLQNGGAATCPVCFASLGEQDFEAVGPRAEFALPDSYRNLVSQRRKPTPVRLQASHLPLQSQPPSLSEKMSGSICNKSGKSGKLVFMRGVVGSGKSTAAACIKKHVEERGGVCFVVGTDHYTKTGMSPSQATGCVSDFLRQQVPACDKDDLVVVVDTCGEKTDKRDVFGVDFMDWQSIEVWPNIDCKTQDDMQGYLAWSLRNVLKRDRPGEASNFALSPVTAGKAVCINVHAKKARALFPKFQKLLGALAGASVDSLEAQAESYQTRAVRPFVVPAAV